MAVVTEFSVNPVLGLNPLLVQFTDLSTGAPDTWLWDFGVTSEFKFVDTVDTIHKDTIDVIWKDYIFSETSSDQNPQFIFEDVGIYTISLTASLGGDSDSEIKSDYIIVLTNILPRPSQLYSGVKEAYFADGWENFKQFLVEQSSPYPCVVQYIDLFVDTTNE